MTVILVHYRSHAVKHHNAPSLEIILEKKVVIHFFALNMDAHSVCVHIPFFALYMDAHSVCV